jgi:hypothetical protein
VKKLFRQPSAIRDCGIPEKFLDRLLGFLPLLTAMLFCTKKGWWDYDATKL